MKDYPALLDMIQRHEYHRRPHPTDDSLVIETEIDDREEIEQAASSLLRSLKSEVEWTDQRVTDLPGLRREIARLEGLGVVPAAPLQFAWPPS